MGQSRKCLVTDDYVETPVRRLWTILRYPRDCPSAVEQLCLLGRLLKLDTGGDTYGGLFFLGHIWLRLYSPARYHR